ncbi:hypothetical protein [Aeromonas veronii]|uniref:hypothetical protein n=1 Tax=Aeromonas veronii TaxID=654 RepID=UPI001E53FFF8|nr:hypothetical protein [Aeromonas veronii]
MTHDEPCSMAPDDKHDLISGTCSHLPKVSSKKLNMVSMLFIMGSTWLVAYVNPNILDLIEAMGAPIIASLLCLLPMYAVSKTPALAKYKGQASNLFVTIIGVLTILNIVSKLF